MSSINKNNPIRQHTVPQVYLKYFHEDSLISVYNKNTKIITSQPIKVTGAINNFYTFDYNNSPNFEIEKYFANKIEPLYDPLIYKIISNIPFTKKEKNELSLFIAFQYLRTPKLRKIHNDMWLEITEQTLAFKNEIQKSIIKQDIVDSSPYNSDIDPEIPTATIPKEISLKFMIENAPYFSDIISQMNFSILKAPSKTQFLTSDHPCCLVPNKQQTIYGNGFIDSIKLFPLTHNILLLMSGSEDIFCYKSINSAYVRKLNTIIADISQTYIYSKNVNFLKSFIRKYEK